MRATTVWQGFSGAPAPTKRSSPDSLVGVSREKGSGPGPTRPTTRRNIQCPFGGGRAWWGISHPDLQKVNGNTIPGKFAKFDQSLPGMGRFQQVFNGFLCYLMVVPGAAPGSPAEEPTNSFFPSVNVMMLPLARFAPSFAW